MDEHKTGGMTEFLKREVRAWEQMRTVGYAGKRKGRLPRWLPVAAFAVGTAALLALALVLFVPWSNIKLPGPDAGQQGGVNQGITNPPAHEESGTQKEEQTTQGVVPEQTPVDPYAYDYSAVPAGAVPIVPMHIGAKQNPVNQTDGEIDMESVMESACLIPAPRGSISVLIIHTHTGEGYNREGALWLEADDEEFARSADGSDGVVAVGARLAQKLNEAGVGTIHCKTVFDGQSNRESYARAADAIKAFRLAYPGLVCVIDVHRAAAINEQGHYVRSLAVKDGQGIAQAQVICGMNAGEQSKTNLALAMLLHERMNTAFAGSCAGVICKSQTLNQDLSPFALTLEIGSCGNTPAEAEAAADVTAAALCTLFLTN
ncbi:MAG: stage II sporulation protein P [Clostridia bacterium]|nr:stage II sporulation protein P [Clostridia bacterium]